jgi:Fe2+ or Zn2+ uptake regulation protein
MSPKDKLISILTANGHSATKPRLLIFELLFSEHKALSVQQIIDMTSDIDTASVYRTVNLFEKIGILNRVWNGFKNKVELSDDFLSHHHHFTCEVCGKLQTITDHNLEHSIHLLQGLYGFEIRHHLIELMGVCSDCLTIKVDTSAK